LTLLNKNKDKKVIKPIVVKTGNLARPGSTHHGLMI